MSNKGRDLRRKLLLKHFNKREAASQDLILAAFMCDKRGVRLALADGANTNIKDISGLTPLLLVVSHNDRKKYHGLLSCLEMLLEYGADLNSSDRKGRTACHIICSNDKIERGDRFAALRMLVNFEHLDDNLTRLRDKEGFEEQLSEAGPSKDCWESALVTVGPYRNSSEPTAKLSRSSAGETKSSPIDVDEDNKEDQFAHHPKLHLGQSLQSLPKDASIFDISRDLSRARSTSRNGRRRWRKKPLTDRWQSNSDMEEVKQENLNQRCNINKPDSGWRTPLLDAARHGFSEAINFLIENKANVNARTRTGETPLHGAIWGLHIDCIDALLSAGCDMNAQDNEGNTFLHLLAINAKNRIETAFIDRTLQVIDRVIKLDCDIQKKRKICIMTAIRESIEILGIEGDMTFITLITDFVAYEGANLSTKNNLNVSAYGIAARLANKKQCSIEIAKALRPRP